MFRDDDIARNQRANALIDEIAELERQQLEQTSTALRLEAARHELSALQPPAAAPPPGPGLAVHLVVFAATAAAAFLGYTLLV
jgi:hypothetical protein